MVGEKILELLSLHEGMTIADIEARIGVSRSTLKLRLRELVENKKINKNGVGKGTWYSSKPR